LLHSLISRWQHRWSGPFRNPAFSATRYKHLIHKWNNIILQFYLKMSDVKWEIVSLINKYVMLLFTFMYLIYFRFLTLLMYTHIGHSSLQTFPGSSELAYLQNQPTVASYALVMMDKWTNKGYIKRTSHKTKLQNLHLCWPSNTPSITYKPLHCVWSNPYVNVVLLLASTMASSLMCVGPGFWFSKTYPVNVVVRKRGAILAPANMKSST